MGNVTSGLIENALQSSPNSSSAAAVAAAAVLPVSGQNSKLRDQLRQIASDPSKLELYRLLQKEMEKQVPVDPAASSDLPKTEQCDSLKNELAVAETDVDGGSSSKPAPMLCPKKKFLKGYRFDEETDQETRTHGAVEEKPTAGDECGSYTSSSSVAPPASLATDSSQLTARSRSNTVSFPVRSRGPHDPRSSGHVASKSGEQYQNPPSDPMTSSKPALFDMNQCIDAVVRSHIVGVEPKPRDLQKISTAAGERYESRPQYVVDREHGPASSVAAYSSARQISRRDDMTPTATIEMSRMAPERASSSSRGPRHVSVGETDPSIPAAGPMRGNIVTPSAAGYDSAHGYYYSDQHAAAVASGRTPMTERSSSRSSQQLTRDRVRQHPGQAVPPPAGGYQMEPQHAGGMVPPTWRQSADTQGSRVAQAQRGGPPPSWSGHQQQQQQQQQHGQQQEIYQRMAEHVKDYDGGGSSAAKYRIMEVPAPSAAGYQQYGASEVAGRGAVYDQRSGYAVESRSKYMPVDVSRAAYPPASSRGSGDTYDTARRQAHEQIETMCSLPPPLLKQRVVQRTPPGSGTMMQAAVIDRQHPQQSAMLPRPLEPVEPTVRPKIPGLMHAEVGAGFDRLPSSDARMLGRSAALQSRDDREYAQYMSRQSRGTMSQQQQQQLGPAMISPPGSNGGAHHRIVSQLESSGLEPVAAASHRQNPTAESPLDLSLRRDEPVTMTAEAFLRRVQDPEHYAATRQEYASRIAYASHDSEMDMTRLPEVRRAEYRMQQQQQQQQQQQYQQQVASTVPPSSAGSQQQYQHSRHESPRTRVEAVPDWVSSRAPPVGLPAEQQRVLQAPASRRQVFADNLRTSTSYAGVSPNESRIHQSEMAHAAFMESRQQVEPLSEESVTSWERRMQAADRTRMQAVSWDSTYGGGSRPAHGIPVSDPRALSSTSSVVSGAARYDQRATMSGQPSSGMPGYSQRMPNSSLAGSQPALPAAPYDSRQPARSQLGHHSGAVSAAVSQAVSGWTQGGTSPAGSAAWMAKDRQDRAMRQDSISAEPSPPSELDPRRGRMAILEVGANPPDLCRSSGASSPSLPQLSPIPQSAATATGASSTIANRRIPIVQLLGSHSPSDILHLRCNVCSLTYGSLRSFRMHFAKVHGLEPGPEHFTIQTISETRTAIARGGISGGLQDLNAVDLADESSLPPPSLQRETGDLTAPDPRCSAPTLDVSLSDQQQQQQRREFALPVKQVAEVYPIPKKSSPVVVTERPVEPATPPEKPSPPIAKRSASGDTDHHIRCHKCHQFSTQDFNVYRHHMKMHAATDSISGRSSTPSSGDVGCYDNADTGCAVCLEGFSDLADWQSHISKSHQYTSECMMRSCACKACDLGFTNAGALRRHLVAVHGVLTSSGGSGAPSVDVEYRCLFCPDAFDDERKLHAHTQAHEQNYILQRKSLGSMPLTRRFAFMRDTLPSSATTHRVQTAVPDTTCPEDQRLMTDAATSGGNSKSGSEDGHSMSSDKSPQADVSEDGSSGHGFAKTSSGRVSPGSNTDSNRVTKTTSYSSMLRTDSLKASIMRRLSATRGLWTKELACH